MDRLLVVCRLLCVKPSSSVAVTVHAKRVRVVVRCAAVPAHVALPSGPGIGVVEVLLVVGQLRAFFVLGHTLRGVASAISAAAVRSLAGGQTANICVNRTLRRHRFVAHFESFSGARPVTPALELTSSQSSLAAASVITLPRNRQSPSQSSAHFSHPSNVAIGASNPAALRCPPPPNALAIALTS